MRIATLDGWRGVAILLVVICHLTAQMSRWWADLGSHGVQIFFVLSGYLITSKLMEGSIHLGRFYIRRVFRLWPVAWVYLAMVAILALWFHKPFGTYISGALLFFYNYLPLSKGVTPAMTGHFWSLSVEEQFYLVWPTILLLTRGRVLIWTLAGFVLDSVVVFCHMDAGVALLHTEYNIHSLLAGCALAAAFRHSRVREILARQQWILPVSVAGIAAHAIYFSGYLPSESGLIAFAIGSTVDRPVKFLASRPLVWLGRISYSVYVWQAFFLVLLPGIVVPAKVALILLAGAASYRWLEAPGIRLGGRVLEELSSIPRSEEIIPQAEL